MTNLDHQATWGPFDCVGLNFVIDGTGHVELQQCDCGAEHPKLIFETGRRLPASALETKE